MLLPDLPAVRGEKKKKLHFMLLCRKVSQHINSLTGTGRQAWFIMLFLL